MLRFLLLLLLGFCIVNAQSSADFKQIENFIEQKNWERVFHELQNIISNTSGGDFSILNTYPKTVSRSIAPEKGGEYSNSYFHLPNDGRPQIVKPLKPSIQLGTSQWAEERFAYFEEEALLFYRKMFDSKSLAVDKAIANCDLKYLAMVAREYLFTTNGPKATEALIEFCIEQGQFKIALNYLRRLLIYRADVVESRIKLICKMAFCYHLLENEAGLRMSKDLLVKVLQTQATVKTAQEKNLPETQLTPELLRKHYFQLFQNEFNPLDRVLGLRITAIPQPEPVVIGETKVDPLKYIESFLERAKHYVQEEDWNTYGGNFKRNKISDVEITLKHQPWSKKLLPQLMRIRSYTYVKYPMPFQPIVADGLIFINNGFGMKAYNLIDGTEKWEYKGFTTETAAMSKEGRSEHLILSATVQGDRIYLNVERKSDDTPDVYRANNPTQRPASFNIQPTYPSRTLVCLDANTGDFLWEAKTQNTVLEEANFSSAPLIIDDLLFCGANFYEGLVRSYFVCLDKNTGKIIYKMLVDSKQHELNMFGRPVREALGAFLSEEDGIVYYCTNLGSLASIDAYSGKLLWRLNYPQSPIKPPVAYQTMYRELQWYNNPLIIHDEYIFITPIDSPQIFALNRLTGKVIWRRDRDDSHWSLRYLIGVDKDKVYLSGTYLVALDIKTGRVRWEEHEGMLRAYGRGVLTTNYIYVPDNNYLYRFSLNGKVDLKPTKSAWKWPDGCQGGGNLLLTNNALILISDKKINVFFDVRETQKKLEKQIKENPNDPALYIKLAALYFQTKDYKESEEKYLKANELGLRNKRYHKVLEKARFGLYQTYLAIAENSHRFSNQFSYYQKALKIANSYKEELPVYLRLIQNYKFKGKEEKVISLFNLLLEKYGNLFYSFETGEEVKVAPFILDRLAKYHVKRNKPKEAVICYQQILELFPHEVIFHQKGIKFAKREIDKLIKRFGSECYRDQEKAANELFAKAKKLDTPEGYNKILDLYPNSKVIEFCQFALIRQNAEKESYKGLVSQIKSMMQEFPKTQFMPQIQFYLFQIYYKEGSYTQAKNVFRWLKLKYPTAELQWKGEKLQVLAWSESIKDERLKGTARPLLDQELSLPQQNGHTWSYKFGLDSFELFDLKEDIPVGCENRIYVLHGVNLYCFNVHKRAELWKRQLGNFSLKSLFYTEKSLLLLGEQEVRAISLDGKTLLWQNKFSELVKAIKAKNGIIASVYQKDRKFCLLLQDAVTGQALENPITVCPDSRFAPSIHITRDFVVVATRNPVTYYVYDLVSGLLHSTIEGRTTFYISDTLIFEPNLLVFLDKEIIDQKEHSILKAYDLEKAGSEAKATWFNTKFSKITHSSLVWGKGNTIGLFQNVINHKQQLVSLNAKNGTLRWRYPELFIAIENRLFDWDYVYFSTLEITKKSLIKQKIIAVDAKNGQVMWKSSTLPGRVPANKIYFKATKKYLCCQIESRSGRTFDTFLIIFDKKSGKMVQKYELKGKDFAEEVKIVDSTLFISKGSTIYSYSAK